MQRGTSKYRIFLVRGKVPNRQALKIHRVTNRKAVRHISGEIPRLGATYAAACGSLTYATDIAIPTVSDYEDFTMPTKPDMANLKVKGTDKL